MSSSASEKHDPVSNLQGSVRSQSKGSTAEAKQWLRDNQAALESYNAWVEENGLPLDDLRQF